MRDAPPTPFPELNELLEDLVLRARPILAGNFVGAYLQGSFALGDSDMESDCDFIVVTGARVTPEEEQQLRALHGEIPTRAGHWTQNLEGSYAPRDELRTLTGLGNRWLYIDRGWREMQWSTHCNTQVVRWTLREYGVTLCGPEPRLLVDEVSPEALRARMREEVSDFLPKLFTWTSFDVAWAQRYAVTTLCRILYTARAGRVASKRASLLWALDDVEPEWRPLIQQALEGRALGWDPNARPTRESVAATKAFVRYAKGRLLGG